MLGFDVRTAKITWTAFLVALLLFVTYSIRTTLLVVVFSIFFAYLFSPLVQLVERYMPRRVPRAAIIALVFILVSATVSLAGVLFGTRIVDEATRLTGQLPQLLDTANISQRIPLPWFLEPQRARLLAFISEQVQTGTGQALPFVQRLGLGVMHAATNLIYLVLVPILSFLLIKEAPVLRTEVLSWLGKANSTLWTTIAEDLNILLVSFVRALLLLSIATFVSYGLIFSALDVPYALLLGGIAALLEIIPFVGPLAAAGIILAVSAFSGYEHLLWLIAILAAYRIFQDYVLSPYLMSEGLQVSPLLVIIGLLAGDELGGVAGIFLSVPLLAALKIIFVRLRTTGRIIGS
ncbi:MAG: family transporter [Herminiimonas sp.]|nr:family transporter [Herminiimonas sp.]